MNRPFKNPAVVSSAARLRAAVNSRRGTLVATVGGLSALGGAVAAGVSALIATAVLTPNEPTGAVEVALMAVETGVVAGLAGSVLGTLAAFGALRAVPLGRFLLYTNVGLTAGLTAGWLGGPWAWHHMGFLGFMGFSGGALIARAFSRKSPEGRSNFPFHPAPGPRQTVPETEAPLLAPPIQPDLAVPVQPTAGHVERRGLPE